MFRTMFYLSKELSFMSYDGLIMFYLYTAFPLNINKIYGSFIVLIKCFVELKL